MRDDVRHVGRYSLDCYLYFNKLAEECQCHMCDHISQERRGRTACDIRVTSSVQADVFALLMSRTTIMMQFFFFFFFSAACAVRISPFSCASASWLISSVLVT